MKCRLKNTMMTAAPDPVHQAPLLLLKRAQVKQKGKWIHLEKIRQKNSDKIFRNIKIQDLILHAFSRSGEQSYLNVDRSVIL